MNRLSRNRNARGATCGFTFLEVLASIVLLAATAMAVVPWLQAARRGDAGFKTMSQLDALERDVERVVNSKLKSSILALPIGETKSLAPPPLNDGGKDIKATRPFFERTGAAIAAVAGEDDRSIVRVTRVPHPEGSTRLRGSFFQFARGDVFVVRWLVPETENDTAANLSTKKGVR